MKEVWEPTASVEHAVSTAQTATTTQDIQHSCSRLQVGLAEQLLLRLLDQGACLQVRLCVAVTAFELSHHPPTATIRGLQGAHLLLAAADCVHHACLGVQ